MENYSQETRKARQIRKCPDCAYYPNTLNDRRETFTLLPSPLITWQDFSQNSEKQHFGNEIVNSQRHMRRVLEKKKRMEWMKTHGEEDQYVDEQ